MSEHVGETAGSFPAEWGTPPGGQFSEERAAWVAERVREQRAVRRVAEEQTRARGGEQARRRRALLMRRRYA
jgi:hypothetical protein